MASVLTLDSMKIFHSWNLKSLIFPALPLVTPRFSFACYKRVLKLYHLFRAHAMVERTHSHFKLESTTSMLDAVRCWEKSFTFIRSIVKL